MEQRLAIAIAHCAMNTPPSEPDETNQDESELDDNSPRNGDSYS